MEDICIGFLLLGLNAAFLGAIFFTRRTIATLNRWPSTMGIVFTSRSEKQRIKDADGHVNSMNFPVVHYSYQVNGQLYESTQVTYGPEFQQKGIESPLVRYPSGAQVKVFYNPRNPAYAVLERRVPILEVLCFLLGLLDLLICGPFLWQVFQMMWRVLQK